MINGGNPGTESPETEGFAPTMMNDIKAADPTAKINLIAPPQANNRGTASLGVRLLKCRLPETAWPLTRHPVQQRGRQRLAR